MPIAARGKVVDPRTGLRPLSMVISQEAKQQQAARESAATAAAAASEKRVSWWDYDRDRNGVLPANCSTTTSDRQDEDSL